MGKEIQAHTSDATLLHIEEISPTSFIERASELSSGGKHPLTAMFGRDESMDETSTAYLSIYVVFEIPEEYSVRTLKVIFSKDDPLSYPTLTTIIPAAIWYEREIFDLFGIRPVGHPDLRPLVLHEGFPAGFHPLLKSVPKDISPREKVDRHVPSMHVAHGEGIFEVPVGPIHAGIIEPGHFRFSQAGETMLALDARLFYTHRGLEKSLEGKSVDDAFFTIERLCGACSIANSWSYVQAVEKIAHTKVPRRAELIRTLLLELERITNHVGDLGNIPAGVGFLPAISLGARAKERLMRLAEELTGNRFLRGAFMLGGVRIDISKEQGDLIHRTLLDISKATSDLSTMFSEQESFQNRVETTGTIRHKTAIDLAMVGIGAKASGYLHDSRQDFSYGAYDVLNLRLHTETAGDVRARILVRIQEVYASIAMVEKLVTLLEDEHSPLSLPVTVQKGEAYGISESARGADFHYVALDKDGKIDRIFIRSASYANWPAVPIATHGDIIADFPLINKSFELCYACIDR